VFSVSERPWNATLGRSIQLFRAFRVEQTDPARFYGELARDAAAHVSSYTPLAGATVLDVGGGPGYFADAFETAGARYFSVDADVREMSAVGEPRRGSVLGSGLQLPIRTASVDICYSSNVLEHVPQPWTMADEMVRVTRPGGLVFISYTTCTAHGAGMKRRRGTTSEDVGRPIGTSAGMATGRRTTTAGRSSR